MVGRGRRRRALLFLWTLFENGYQPFNHEASPVTLAAPWAADADTRTMRKKASERVVAIAEKVASAVLGAAARGAAES